MTGSIVVTVRLPIVENTSEHNIFALSGIEWQRLVATDDGKMSAKPEIGRNEIIRRAGSETHSGAADSLKISRHDGGDNRQTKG
ncbi:MAG: hypothetical protein ABSE90_13615 [Verrucomicrobiota bacterium]|jgi:hypothetical protein